MIKRDVIEYGVPEQRVRDIERIQALMSKWTGGSTSGDLGAQVAFLERFLPATFRDVAPEYARAVEAGEKYPKLVAARNELAAAAAAVTIAQDAHAKLVARVAELEGRITTDSHSGDAAVTSTYVDLAPGTLVEYRHAGHSFDGLVLEVIERFDDGDSSTGPWYRCTALCTDDTGWPVRRPVAGIHGSRLHPAPDGARFGDDVGQVRRAAGQTSILPEPDPAPALARPLEPGDLAVVRRPRDLWNGQVVRVLLPEAGLFGDMHLLVQGSSWSGPIKMWINRANLEHAPDGAEYGDCS